MLLNIYSIIIDEYNNSAPEIWCGIDFASKRAKYYNWKIWTENLPTEALFNGQQKFLLCKTDLFMLKSIEFFMEYIQIQQTKKTSGV